MKFRKRPVEIEAQCWLGTVTTAAPIIEWILDNGGTARYHGELATVHPQSIHIDTPEGTMQAQPGDWIIRGVEGEFYPCKPSVFEASYEPVIDGPTTPVELINETR